MVVKVTPGQRRCLMDLTNPCVTSLRRSFTNLVFFSSSLTQFKACHKEHSWNVFLSFSRLARSPRPRWTTIHSFPSCWCYMTIWKLLWSTIWLSWILQLNFFKMKFHDSERNKYADDRTAPFSAHPVVIRTFNHRNKKFSINSSQQLLFPCCLPHFFTECKMNQFSIFYLRTIFAMRRRLRGRSFRASKAGMVGNSQPAVGR